MFLPYLQHLAVCGYLPDPWRHPLYLVTVTLLMPAVADSARFHRFRPRYAVGYPLTSALCVYILLRTMMLNLLRGGIYWRGTFYPLEEWKRNKV